MPFTLNRRGVTTVAVAATTSLCCLSAIWQTHADAPAGATRPAPAEGTIVPADSSIPFDPPVVHPGLGPGFPKPAANRQRSATRDLQFRDADRKSFKALHPFLLGEPQKMEIQEKPEKSFISPASAPVPAPETTVRVGRYTLIGEAAGRGELKNVILYMRSNDPKRATPARMGYAASALPYSRQGNVWALKNLTIHSYDATGIESTATMKTLMISDS